MHSSEENPTPRRTNYPHHHNRSPYTPQTPHIINQTLSDSSNPQNRMVIYGTTLQVKKFSQSFRRYNFVSRFLIQFQTNIANIQGVEQPCRVYYQKMFDLTNTESNYPSLNIDASHILEWSRDFYFNLISYPGQLIQELDNTLSQVFRQKFVQLAPLQYRQKLIKFSSNMTVTIINLHQTTRMRDLQPEKILNKLVAVRGFVIRVSQIYPQMASGYFKCPFCKSYAEVKLYNGQVDEPTFCQKCKKKATFELVHNLCKFQDKQIIKLQQLPQNVPDGQTPQSVNLIAYDSNIDKIRPGDRVQIVGIFRTQQKRVNRGKRTIMGVYNTFLDVISMQFIVANRFKTDQQGMSNFTQQQAKYFNLIARDPNIYQKLADSLAPNIWQCDSIKKGILCQLFGGSKDSKVQSKKFRSNINVLLVGDPSTAKSQLLKYVHNLAPRSVYTTGKGSSAMGLTAIVTKDPETHQFILQSGALVLADLGICCLDEFDKMDQGSKTALLQAMQQQTISVAKAGIVCQLNSRTSILAAANPIRSMYDSKKSVVQNINMPPALLSRFDLIYLLLDRPSQKNDAKLAQHIVSLFSAGGDKSLQKNENFIDRKTFTNFITYARKTVFPKITQSIKSKIVQAYINMRKLGINKKVISATPRQLESIIRISEALAKMRLSFVVEQKDVEEALFLIKEATQQAATDYQTGIVNMDMLVLGATAQSKMRVGIKIQLEQIQKCLITMIQANPDEFKGKGKSFPQMITQIKKRIDFDDLQDTQLLKALQHLQSQQEIVLVGNKKKPMVRLATAKFD